MSEVTPALLHSLFDRIRADGVEVRACSMAEHDADLSRRGAKSVKVLPGEVRAGNYFNRSHYPTADVADLPEFMLAINEAIDLDDQFSTALHEWGHHRCHVEGCRCSNPDVFQPVAEAHVHRFVLRELMTQDMPTVTCRYLSAIADRARSMADVEAWDAQVMAELFMYLAKCNAHWREAASRYPEQMNAVLAGPWSQLIARYPVEGVKTHLRSWPGVRQDERYRLLVEDFLNHPTL